MTDRITFKTVEKRTRANVEPIKEQILTKTKILLQQIDYTSAKSSPMLTSLTPEPHPTGGFPFFNSSREIYGIEK